MCRILPNNLVPIWFLSTPSYVYLYMFMHMSMPTNTHIHIYIQVSRERIWAEFRRILSGPRAAMVLERMAEDHVLEGILHSVVLKGSRGMRAVSCLRYVTCMHACVYSCAFVCVYVCMYIYIYIYILYIYIIYIYLCVFMYTPTCAFSCVCEHMAAVGHDFHFGA
jgi:hypothetical protein